MIYIFAFFVPPLALLLNRQPFAAIFNVMLIVPCLFFGLIFHVLLLVPSAHAIIAIYHDARTASTARSSRRSASMARRRDIAADCRRLPLQQSLRPPAPG